MEASEAPPVRKSSKRGARGNRRRPSETGDDGVGAEPSMAVSIAGVSTACSKDALVSSAETVRKRLSTD
jgi:hypothetical protein